MSIIITLRLRQSYYYPLLLLKHTELDFLLSFNVCFISSTEELSTKEVKHALFFAFFYLSMGLLTFDSKFVKSYSFDNYRICNRR